MRGPGWVPALARAAGDGAPETGGELRPRGVRGADEEHGVRRDGLGARGEVGERVADEAHVAAALITGGDDALDHASAFEDVEVMGEQIRGDLEHGGEVGRRTVGEREGVDDGKAARIAEGGMDGGTLFSRARHGVSMQFNRNRVNGC